MSSSDPGAALTGTPLDDFGHSPHAETALLEFDTSEFGRFRAQYTHDESDLKPSDEILFQYTVIYGRTAPTATEGEPMRNYLILAALAAFATPAHANLNVFACEPEWGALSTEIGGDKVSVYTATTGAQDPHQSRRGRA